MITELSTILLKNEDEIFFVFEASHLILWRNVFFVNNSKWPDHKSWLIINLSSSNSRSLYRQLWFPRQPDPPSSRQHGPCTRAGSGPGRSATAGWSRARGRKPGRRQRSCERKFAAKLDFLILNSKSSINVAFEEYWAEERRNVCVCWSNLKCDVSGGVTVPNYVTLFLLF